MVTSGSLVCDFRVASGRLPVQLIEPLASHLELLLDALFLFLQSSLFSVLFLLELIVDCLDLDRRELLDFIQLKQVQVGFVDEFLALSIGAGLIVPMAPDGLITRTDSKSAMNFFISTSTDGDVMHQSECQRGKDCAGVFHNYLLGHLIQPQQ
jgi:hypothetical protein